MEVSSPMGTIEAVLVTRRFEILEAFVQRVRRRDLVRATVSAAEIARPISGCLTWMSRALVGLHTEPADCTRLACEYADDRKRLGYELPAIVAELALLRAALVEVAFDNGVRDPRQTERAAALIDRLAADAITRHTTKSVTTTRMPAFRRSR